MAVTRRRRGDCRGAVAIVLLCVSLQVTAAAVAMAADGWVKSYKLGVEAFDRHDWDRAIHWLTQAIEEQPKESARTPKLLFRRYVPYYYLGAAWYESGNCDEALKALEESQLQGVINDMPEFYDLQRKRRKCEARSDRTAALEKTQESIERATAASAQVAELQRHPELSSVWTWRENSLGSRQERAERLLEEARASLARDPQRLTTAQLQAAGEKAAQARWQLEAIRVEASQHLGEVRELIDQERQRLDSLLKKASQVRSAAEALRPWPEGVSSRVVTLERTVRRARRARDEAVIETLAAAGADLEAAIAALGMATSLPPRVLEVGVQAFFAGDYEKAVKLLGAARVSGRRALAHLYLLRSAARYALFRTGDQDLEMMTQARRDARLCRQQDSSLEPSTTLFSPGFRDFFRLQSRVELDRSDG